jgi:hypothetical protein
MKEKTSASNLHGSASPDDVSPFRRRFLTTCRIVSANAIFCNKYHINSRNRTGSTPLVECFLSMGNNLLAVSEQFQTPWILLDLVDRSVELGNLAVRREHIGP